MIGATRLMTLGEFVRHRRGVLDLTQDDVIARMPRRTKSWLSRVENDQIENLPDPEVLHDLADVLECPVMDLVQAYGYHVETPDEPAFATTPVDGIRRLLREADWPAEAKSAIEADLNLVEMLERRRQNGNG